MGETRCGVFCAAHKRAHAVGESETATSETPIMNPFKLLWSFHGRAGRGAYAGGLLLNLAWASAAAVGLIYVGRDAMLEAYPSLQLGSLVVPLATLLLGAKAVVTTLFAWGKCGLMAKRLHDLGHNGWICLVVFIPGINLIAVISLLIARGDDFDNPYGPSRNQLGGPDSGNLALNR
jgi:uncharacterized membrane protein YhaH (DUF805 family)